MRKHHPLQKQVPLFKVSSSTDRKVSLLSKTGQSHFPTSSWQPHVDGALLSEAAAELLPCDGPRGSRVAFRFECDGFRWSGSFRSRVIVSEGEGWRMEGRGEKLHT